jgi:hypothetical protein
VHILFTCIYEAFFYFMIIVLETETLMKKSHLNLKYVSSVYF